MIKLAHSPSISGEREDRVVLEIRKDEEWFRESIGPYFYLACFLNFVIKCHIDGLLDML